eukprot:s727_g13.t1
MHLACSDRDGRARATPEHRLVRGVQDQRRRAAGPLLNNLQKESEEEGHERQRLLERSECESLEQGHLTACSRCGRLCRTLRVQLWRPRAMKVTLKYEEAQTEDLFMTLRLTLPQKYVNGTNKEVVKLFVDHYNKKKADNMLSSEDLHLKIVGGIHLDNEERVRDSLSNGDECYLLGKDSEGPAPKRQEAEKGYQCTPAAASSTTESKVAKNADGKVRCKNFGCQMTFDPNGPPQECLHHKSAPIFHETAKWWSCCPDKKAYEFDEFMRIPGCTKGFCSSESQGKKAKSSRNAEMRDGAKGHHLWPHSMCVLLDGRELARVNPPENQRRPDSPLKLQPPDKAGGHVFQLFAGGKPPGSMSSASEDFVLCLVVTQKRRSVADLLDDCVSTQLLTELRCAEVGVRSNTPWQQPLRCPLTQERLVEPARGMHCQHLQCFELEAFLITAAAMPFQRRWRCPICDAQLRPAQVAICEMTRRFLRELPAEASLAPLEASAASAGQVAASNTCDLTAEPAVPVPVHVAKSARMQRGHWGRRLRCEVQQGKELD